VEWDSTPQPDDVALPTVAHLRQCGRKQRGNAEVRTEDVECLVEELSDLR
jgi:hypothetical protein